MRSILLFSAVAVAAAAPLFAQNPPPAAAPAVQAQRAGIKLADVAGRWEIRSMVGPKDSVIVTYTLTATADGKGWTITFTGRDPIPARVVSVGGDSIIIEAGPFNSVLRPGQMVSTRTVSHYAGDTATGTFEARYASGDVLRGKVAATRKK
jgi:hypothetical protein